MTPTQTWLFLFLMFYSLGITAYAVLWRARYYDAQSYRIYASKQKAYEQNRMDAIYSQSFMRD